MTGFKSKKQAAMNKREMTPWFPASTPPDRVGVYLVKGSIPMYSKWDGEHWCRIAFSVEGASRQKFASVTMYSTTTPEFWRGFIHEQ